MTDNETTELPADGTTVRMRQAGLTPGRSSMPGVPAGTIATVRHESPSGHTNIDRRLVWLELDDRIRWSHGLSEHPGFWASPHEFDEVSG